MLKKCFICFKESPFKMMKNVLSFILKAHFILKIGNSQIFGHIEKRV